MNQLPDVIQAFLPGYASTGENHRTSSKAEVYFYSCPDRPGLFLKIRHIDESPGEAALHAEKVAMEWLQGKLRVPQVVCYHKEKTTEYLLTTQIRGWSAENDRFKADIPTLVKLLAQGLREIHSLPVDDCPLDCRVETLLAQAQQMRIEPQETLNEIFRKRPPVEDIVFTHGDYCLPNVLIQDSQLMGFIDWGYAGVGDRYRDFVSALYSIRRNLGGEWAPLFFEEYGVYKVDQKKMGFYQLIHDLTF